MEARREERLPYFRRAVWDFFTGSTGGKSGFIANVSKSGCLLKSADPIDHRRWVRILIEDDRNVHFSVVGRAVRCENILESISDTEFTLYRYGIQFTQPCFLSLQADLTLALSSRNLSVVSCRSLNTKSSLRPGFLA